MEIYRIPLSRYLRGIAKNSRIGEIPNISAESSRKVLAKSLGRAIRNRDENRNALENFIAIFVARRITNQREREREWEKQSKRKNKGSRDISRSRIAVRNYAVLTNASTRQGNKRHDQTNTCTNKQPEYVDAC